MKVLVTAFDAFGGEQINPSSEALKLVKEEFDSAVIIKKILPTTFDLSFDILKTEIDRYKPDMLISIGQAGGRSKVSIERIAINIDDARIKDNSGNQPIDKTIVSHAPAAYFSTLPIKAIAKNINDQHIACEVSNTAGTFVCNHIMYQALHYSNQNQHSFKSGFIHIPFIKEQIQENSQVPFMALEDIVTAIEIAIKTSIDYFNKDDLKINAGKEF